MSDKLDLDYSEWRMADARLQRILNREYPDGTIHRLPKHLYTRVWRRVRRHRMTMKEYLPIIGFKYVPKRDSFPHFRNEEELVAALNREYPDKSVASLHKSKLYSWVLRFAEKQGMTVWEFLEGYGFYYSDLWNRGAKWEEETLRGLLEQAFPERVVDLGAKLWFERALQNTAIRNGETKRQLLQRLDFRISGATDPEARVADLRALIKESYPDGIVRNISKQPWYGRLQAYCRKESIPIRQFVEEQGFHYPRDSAPVLLSGEELAAAVLDWVRKGDPERPMSEWPMYRSVKKEAAKQFISPLQYIQELVDKNGITLTRPKSKARQPK